MSEVLEISTSSRAKGSLIKVKGELPLDSLNILKKSKILKIPLEKLRSINKYRVSKRDVNVFKCLKDEDIQHNLVVVEILYEGGEIKLLISSNEASKLDRIFDKWLAA
ncbi:MAG: hypothetical protein QN229_00145 [Desulfurococcaceae archaeon TW002]